MKMACGFSRFLLFLFLSSSIISDCFVPSSRSFSRSTVLFRQISTIPLRDGRKVKVHNSDFYPQLRLRVQRVARAAIRKKNSFSFCLTGSVAGCLIGLPKNLPYNKWHIFVADELVGENKTYNKILASLENNVPIENIHFIGQGVAANVAMDYEKEIRLHPAVDNKGSGCPHVDLMLLEAGVKGRVARLLPDSREVKDTGMSSQAMMAVQGEGSVTVSMDFIRAARTILVCATGIKKSPMLEVAFTRSFYKHECPAGMIYSNKNTVLWYTDLEAMTHFRACIQRMREEEFKRQKDLCLENNMITDAPAS